MAFNRLEPFGGDRADMRMAILAALIANANRNPEKQSKPFTPADFLPEYGVDEDELRDRERERLAQKMDAFAAQFGAR
jgi:hypothetical protein